MKGSKPEWTICINIRDWAAAPFCSVSDLRAFRLKPLSSYNTITSMNITRLLSVHHMTHLHEYFSICKSILVYAILYELSKYS